MARMRFASAVVPLREQSGRVEVYLVERNPKLRFFGGYWAFPGGVVDQVDRLGSFAGQKPALRELLRCGMRELFEETGLLTEPLNSTLPNKALEPLRKALIRDEHGPWAVHMEKLNGEPDLEPLCTITTPPFAPVLYRTQFLLARLRDEDEPQVLHGELVAGEFREPGELLEQWSRGDILVAPPTLYLLRLLHAGGLDQFKVRADKAGRELERGRLHEVYHTPGVLTVPLLTPTLPPATTTNCYLVGEKKIYIVDPATYEEGERERLFERLDEWRAEGRELCGVIATHHHHDHVGSIHAVAERYNLPVFGHALTLERLPEPPADTRELKDGDRLDLGRAPDGRADWSMTAFHTPGHDRGHMVLLESRYQALIAGDLVSTLSTIIIDPPEGHLATYLASLRRMAELDLKFIYPAHGPAHRNGVALLNEYLEHRAEREQSLLEQLGEETRTHTEMVPGVYGELDTELAPLAARSLLAGLIKLEEEGLVVRSDSGWCRTA